MKTKHFAIAGLGALALLGALAVAVVRPGSGNAQDSNAQPTSFAATVRSATERFKSLDAAKAAGYGLLHGCVSGQQDGAMGLHYANPDIVGDGAIDASRPEALLYEFRGGKYELTAVEYVVIAQAWDAQHDAPPVLMGQLFNYVSAPNRFGLPAFYELHVWAWKTNPSGTFADWNPTVSCDDFTGSVATPSGQQYDGQSHEGHR